MLQFHSLVSSVMRTCGRACTALFMKQGSSRDRLRTCARVPRTPLSHDGKLQLLNPPSSAQHRDDAVDITSAKSRAFVSTFICVKQGYAARMTLRL